jgi:hypothetical protein
LQTLENELPSDVSNGTISSSDQSALSTALTSINNALQSDASSGQSSSSSPADLKSKISDLIGSEVQNGTLTSNQATELQNIFSSAFSQGGAGGPGGAGGGPSGPGGPSARVAAAILRAPAIAHRALRPPARCSRTYSN